MAIDLNETDHSTDHHHSQHDDHQNSHHHQDYHHVHCDHGKQENHKNEITLDRPSVAINDKLNSVDNGNRFLARISELILNESKIVGNPDWVQANNSKVINFKQPAELEVNSID